MSGDYETVSEVNEGEMSLKGSRFIGISMPCPSEQSIKENLAAAERRYPNATHDCYAAVYDGADRRERSSDNGEPSGTAGKPMMAVLRGSGLSDTMVIAVRYFGGTLLGTGGLVHAYTESATMALDGVKKVRRTLCTVYTFTLDYPTYSRFEALMSDMMAVRPECAYTDKVDVRAHVRTGDEEAFEKRFSDLTERRTVPFRAGTEYV